MIKSTIKNSEEDDAESDPNSNPKVDTYTNNGNFPHTWILNWHIPNIIQGAIRPIEQTILEGVAVIKETLDAQQTILLKKIVTNSACSGAHIFRTPMEESRTVRYGTMPRDGNPSVGATRLTSPVHFFHSATNSPLRNRNQEIINHTGPISHQWIRNAKKLKTSIDECFAEDRGLKPVCSKVFGCKFADDYRVNVYSWCGMNSGINAVFTPNPNFINLEIASVNTTDKLGYVSVPTTRARRPTSRSGWIRYGHDIEKATTDRVSETRENCDCI